MRGMEGSGKLPGSWICKRPLRGCILLGLLARSPLSSQMRRHQLIPRPINSNHFLLLFPQRQLHPGNFIPFFLCFSAPCFFSWAGLGVQNKGVILLVFLRQWWLRHMNAMANDPPNSHSPPGIPDVDILLMRRGDNKVRIFEAMYTLLPVDVVVHQGNFYSDLRSTSPRCVGYIPTDRVGWLTSTIVQIVWYTKTLGRYTTR